MGVPGLFRYVRGFDKKTHKRIIEVKWDNISNKVSTLSIDANALLYVASAEIFGRPQGGTQTGEDDDTEDILKVHKMLELVINLIVQIAQYYRPEEVLFIAFDGVIPLSKLKQQKERRYASALEMDRVNGFDRNAFTPGTRFMKRFDTFMQNDVLTDPDICSMLSAKRIYYSPYTSPGEGEHKIFDYFRQGKMTGDGYHVIFGVDNDLINIALVNNFPKIVLGNDSVPLSYLRPEIVDFKGHRSAPRRVNLKLKGEAKDRQHPTNIFIDPLREVLLEKLEGHSIQDLILMMSIVGNDFIPRPFIMDDVAISVESIIDAIVETNLQLTREDKVSWSGVSQVLERIAAKEPELVRQVAKKVGEKGRVIKAAQLAAAIGPIPVKVDNTREQLAEFGDSELDDRRNFDNFRSMWYGKALGVNNPTILERLGYLTGVIVSKDDIADMCVQFIKGLSWTYKYYYLGMKSVTWQWCYPYHYSPMITDLYQVLRDMPAGHLGMQPSEEEELLPIGIPHQLVAVMPALSLGHVPPKLRKLWEPSSPLSDLMPTAFIVDTSTSTDQFKALALVPPPNFNRIYNAVADLKLIAADFPRTGDVVNETRSGNPSQDAFARMDAIRRLLRQRDDRGVSRGQVSQTPRSDRGMRSDRGQASRGGDRDFSRGSRGAVRGSRGDRDFSRSDRDSRGSRGSGRGLRGDRDQGPRDFSRGSRGGDRDFSRGSRGGRDSNRRGRDQGSRDFSRGGRDSRTDRGGRGDGMFRGAFGLSSFSAKSRGL